MIKTGHLLLQILTDFKEQANINQYEIKLCLLTNFQGNIVTVTKVNKIQKFCNNIFNLYCILHTQELQRPVNVISLQQSLTLTRTP